MTTGTAHRASRRCAGALAMAVLAGVPSANAQPRPPEVPAAPTTPACADTRAVVDRAVAYVRALGSELGSVIATEDYRQDLVGPVDVFEQPTPPPITIVGTIRVQPAAPMTKRDVVRQTLRSSFLFVRLPAEEAWLGFRDVQQVNGKRVRHAAPAPLEVTGETAGDRWRRLSAESARYNLGSITRTLNVPTFALMVLHPDNATRFRFTAGDGVAASGTCVVAFQETGSPTIVRSAVGADVPASGAFTIDAASGRVLRSELLAGSTEAGVASKATVDYALEPRLRLWLPSRMREEYVARSGERLECQAKYSGYQRTDVTVTIRPEP